MTLRHLLAAMAAIAVGSPASAQLVQRSVAVHHYDLDLSRSNDIARLDRRIARAAVSACGFVSPIDLHGSTLARRCVRDAVKSANVQRDHLLDARHASASVAIAGGRP